MMNRKEMNEEMMMNVNGGLLIVDRDNPESPDVGAPVVLEDEADEVKEFIEKLITPKTYVDFIKDHFFG